MREIGRRVCLTVSRVFVWSAFHAGKRISHNERTIMKIQSLVLLLSMAMASVAGANGALAIDSNQGDQYGFSYDYSSMSEAQSRALSECGYGCRVVQTFSSGCAAYAADQARGSTAYGWGTAYSGGQAQNTALQYCRSQGGQQCTVRAWGCNSN